MKLRTFIAAAAVGAVATATPAALAQTPDPISGGTTIGATVPNSLELIITQPKAFPAFSKAKTYSTSFDVSVVTTADTGAELSLADGEVASGSKMGRLASGKKLLPLPLEARVGKSAFSLLSSPVASELTSWREPVSRAKATVSLRQKVKAKATGNYRKVLLVTLSDATP